MNETMIVVAVVVGIVGRAILPYLEAAKKAADVGEEFKFNVKYLAAPVLTGVLALFMVPAAIEAVPEGADNLWAVLAFVLSWEVPDKLRLLQKVVLS